VNSSTYRGLHVYGKSGGRCIERQVPALVDEETWRRAREQLLRNRQFARKNRREDYLLSGLVRCHACGSLYAGHTFTRPNGQVYSCYHCNGWNKSPVRETCRARMLPRRFEETVWAYAEQILREPETALALLSETPRESSGAAEELARAEALLRGMDLERDRVLSLYRRGRIDDADLDRQLDAVSEEATRLRERAEKLRRAADAEREEQTLAENAGALLRSLGRRLEAGPLSFEERREVLGLLIRQIVVETVGGPGNGQGRVVAYVHWRFASRASRLE
jgi:site-specific DNA recombinase